MNIKHTQESVKNYVRELGYELLSEYKNPDTKIILKDDFGYMYLAIFCSMHNQKKHPDGFSH